MRKVTSVKHRNSLLKIAHGDVYTKSKLARFGLIDSPNCPRCGEIEDLQHKVITCEYVKRIWEKTISVTDTLKINTRSGLADPIENRILGASDDTNSLILSIHAEILMRILGLKDDANYTLRPNFVVRHAISLIKNSERNSKIKEDCETLLSDYL